MTRAPKTSQAANASPTAAAWALVTRLTAMGRGRVARVALLGVLAGLAEGVGILALAPILKLTGLEDATATDPTD